MIFYVVISVWVTANWAETCSTVLAHRVDPPDLVSVWQLNPSLVDHLTGASIEELYVVLKQEEYLYATEYYLVGRKKLTLTPEHARHLAETMGTKYSFDGLNERQITQFYVNALRFHYMIVAERIYRNWIRQVDPTLSAREETSVLGGLNRYFSPNDLFQDTLTPQAARDLFAGSKQKNFSWIQDLIRAVRGDLDPALSVSRRNLQAGQDFIKWRNGQLCCKSEGGCWDCPLNRPYLRAICEKSGQRGRRDNSCRL